MLINCICKTPISKVRSHSDILGISTSTYLIWGVGSNSTCNSWGPAFSFIYLFFFTSWFSFSYIIKKRMEGTLFL